jgi:hypothetical protein
MFAGGLAYIESISGAFPDNTIFYGEYLQKPKHNVLAYKNVPANNIALFGVSDLAGNFSHYDDIRACAVDLNIDCVPRLFTGTVNGVDEIHDLLDRDSYLGGTKIEGIVVKNYTKDILIGGHIVPIMCGKYVSEKFKEVHQKNWKGENTSRGKWDIYKTSFRADARWEKAVQHLHDAGQLEDAPRDIGALIKEVHRDIDEECKEEIKDFLWREFGKEVLRTSTAGIAEWYKERLLRESIG